MVRVVGDRPELGSWDPYDRATDGNLELRTGSTSYPRWGLLAPVWIELSHAGSAVMAQDGFEEDDTVDYEYDDDDTPPTPTTPGALDGFEDPDLKRSSSSCSAEIRSLVHVEYKFLKDRRQVSERGPSIQWEDCIANRRVALPCEPGTIWVISDGRFNDASRPAQVARASLPEVVKRWNDLDPEWTSKGGERGAPEWSEVDRGDGFSPRSVKTYCSGHTTSTALF